MIEQGAEIRLMEQFQMQLQKLVQARLDKKVSVCGAFKSFVNVRAELSKIFGVISTKEEVEARKRNADGLREFSFELGVPLTDEFEQKIVRVTVCADFMHDLGQTGEPSPFLELHASFGVDPRIYLSNVELI